MSDAASMALLTAGVVVITTEYNAIHTGGGFVMKPVIAGFGLGVVVLATYAASSSLGAAFAWLIIVGAVLTNGLGILDGVSTFLSTKPKVAKKSTPKKKKG